METIAISGRSGFLGSHLADRLSSKGYQVEAISRDLLYSPNDLREFFDRLKPTYIFHLAAYGNMSDQKDAAMTVLANTIGTFNMLKESLGVFYRAFINIGSSSEYGNKALPMKETDVLEPTTMYAASKAGATHLAEAFRNQYNRRIITVRPFSVYGPKEATKRFIPTVIQHVKDQTPFPLEENAVHDWIYVDDFLDGLEMIMKNDRSQSIVNIGSGKMYTNKEVCRLISEIMGKPYLNTKVEDLRLHRSEVWMSDNTRINNMGWYPKHTLREGLEETIKAYEQP